RVHPPVCERRRAVERADRRYRADAGARARPVARGAGADPSGVRPPRSTLRKERRSGDARLGEARLRPQGQMKRALLDGVELEYELRGSGEPVVLIHWGVGVVWAEPLLDEPALADRYRLLSYHRAGFAGSGRIEGSISMAEHAEHCRLLMRQVGIERA